MTDKLICDSCARPATDYYSDGEMVDPMCKKCAGECKKLYMSDKEGHKIAKCKRCDKVRPLGAFFPADREDLDDQGLQDALVEDICHRCAKNMDEVVEIVNSGDQTTYNIRINKVNWT